MVERFKELLIDQQDVFLKCFSSHIRLCLTGIIIVTLIGVPLGILCAKNQKLGSGVVNFTNFLNMIPTLSMLILLMPVIGAGTKSALLVLCIGCIPVQIINTRMGILNINPHVIEAATGIGMNKWQRLFRIELPLAFPLIVTGFRISLIQAISTSTIASYVGSTSLGDYIVKGFYGGARSVPVLLVGAVSIAVLTVSMDGIMGIVQRASNRRFGAEK